MKPTDPKSHHIKTFTRREMLCKCAHGFGALALQSMLAGTASSLMASTESTRAPHFPPKVKNVIFLFMDGGPSQVDTFDPKPRLAAEHGQPIKMEVPHTQFNDVGKVLKSPWEFRNYGQSGIPVSDLFPHTAQCVDDLAIIRSMTASFSEHTQGNFFMHSGRGVQGWPSMGSWITYGLGSESQDLPGFIVLDSGLIPPGGIDVFGSGFLPATFQGSLFRQGEHPVADLQRTEASEEEQLKKLDLVRTLNGRSRDRFGDNDKVDATISNFELAFRMQMSVPGVMDLTGESPETIKLYGLDEKETETFGRQCLVARRLIEKGVRFVELLPPNLGGGIDRWDQHFNLEMGHAKNAKAVDKPIAGLLMDLKARGMLDETLVLWGGEFGRTPMAQGFNGRDHNPFGFTMWMAGAGIKGGTIFGATDDYGYFAVENKVDVHDLHATILHLLGMDHKRLTYPFSGRDMRLTDVSGNVIKDILA